MYFGTHFQFCLFVVSHFSCAPLSHVCFDQGCSSFYEYVLVSSTVVLSAAFPYGRVSGIWCDKRFYSVSSFLDLSVCFTSFSAGRFGIPDGHFPIF